MTADLEAAADRLNQRMAASLRRVMDATFAACGFAFRQRDHGAEIARQCRAKGEQFTGDFAATLTDIICAVFDTFGHEHDRGLVRAEVDRHLGGQS